MKVELSFKTLNYCSCGVSCSTVQILNLLFLVGLVPWFHPSASITTLCLIARQKSVILCSPKFLISIKKRKLKQKCVSYKGAANLSYLLLST